VGLLSSCRWFGIGEGNGAKNVIQSTLFDVEVFYLPGVAGPGFEQLG
jgi:hypothetical protein